MSKVANGNYILNLVKTRFYESLRIEWSRRSYPFAEHWEIEATEKEVISAIRELGKTNPGFRSPSTDENISSREGDSEGDYWLYIDLYYPDTKELVHSWTRPLTDTTKTTFALVSLEPLDNPSGLRLINRDFWFLPNRRQIRRFESTFVDKIVEQIRKRRAS